MPVVVPSGAGWQASAGVHNPACMLLQSLAEKCRELIYGCGLLQDGHFSHADVVVAWWAPADGPACILTGTVRCASASPALQHGAHPAHSITSTNPARSYHF
jgi:hypothetical protein